MKEENEQKMLHKNYVVETATEQLDIKRKSRRREGGQGGVGEGGEGR